MFSAILSIVLRLFAIAVVMLASDQLIRLVPSDPGAALRFICTFLMLFVLASGVWKLLPPHRDYMRSAPAGPAILNAEGVVDADDEDDFQLERRARHEAAHAVVAFHFRKPRIRADVVRTHRVGGSVSYGGVHGPLADITYQDMQICFAGQIVDIAAGYIDGGAQDDMRRITDLAMMILSTGARPEGLTGRVTAERLVRSARADAAAILAKYEPAIDRIATALIEKRILNTVELTTLMDLPIDESAAA